jgi:hypothetical protein
MGRLNMPDVRKVRAAEERAMVMVELFQDFDDGWWWRARECKLMRGPFTEREQADDDADEHAQILISTLAERALRQR